MAFVSADDRVERAMMRSLSSSEYLDSFAVMPFMAACIASNPLPRPYTKLYELLREYAARGVDKTTAGARLGRGKGERGMQGKAGRIRTWRGYPHT